METKSITLSHGSGGKDSALLMEEIFSKHFSNDILDKLEDGAVLPVGEDRIVTSTDSFVVTPIIFKGGDIGKLSICGTVNDILMMGAKPRYITCGFIIEEGLELSVLDKIVESAAKAACEAEVKIVAGDTKVIEKRSDEPGLFINTTGIGFLSKDVDVSAANCREGDAVIVSGNLGNHHACILSSRMNIDNNIQSDCAVLSQIPDSLYKSNIGIKAMRDVTRGGLGTVLNELADSSAVSIVVQEENIPVDQEVKGFCGIMGLDPLYMANEGKMIIVVDGKDSKEALKQIRSTELGKNAVVLGHIQSGNGVYIKTKIGGTRKVDLLYGEGLPRIC